MTILHIIPTKFCGVMGFWKNLQIKKWSISYVIFQNTKKHFTIKHDNFVIFLIPALASPKEIFVQQKIFSVT